jgi:hypothetical protein
MNKGRFFLFFFAAFFIMLFSPFNSAQAEGHNSYISISGHVTDNDGKQAKDASVEITCGNDTRNVNSDRSGRYIVNFSSNTCHKGNKITVFTNNENQTGIGEGSVNNSGKTDIDVNCNNNPVAVPEFGLVPGIITTVISGGSFLILKKRKN